MSKPLGEYAQFADWQQSVPWGPDGAWRATFGAGVVADVERGIRAFPAVVAAKYPGKAEAYPVALGCVPWFTSLGVANALLELGGDVLVIVDKGQDHRAAVQRLASAPDCGFRQSLIEVLADFGPLNEHNQVPVISPYGPMPGDRTIGPVRVAGWRADSVRAPIVHVKMLVLAASYTWDTDYGSNADHLEPMRVWFGSANWTAQSPKHLEFGAWSDDRELCRAAWRFLGDLVAFSEPLEAGTASPEPELVAAEWDDAAFAEAAAERADDHEPDE